MGNELQVASLLRRVLKKTTDPALRARLIDAIRRREAEAWAKGLYA